MVWRVEISRGAATAHSLGRQPEVQVAAAEPKAAEQRQQTLTMHSSSRTGIARRIRRRAGSATGETRL